MAVKDEIDEVKNVKYEIIDFQGYLPWTMRDDSVYAVDPLYLEKFKKEKNIK